MKKVCMVVPSFTAKGGIASVVSGYRGSNLEKLYDVKYIETYCDGNKVHKLFKAIGSYFQFAFNLLFWKPDIIHIHSSFGASFYRKLPFIYFASWFHKPIINHIHGSALDDLYTNAGVKKKKLVLNTFNKCNKLIVLSEEWKEKYASIIIMENISVIENYSIIHKIENYDNKEHPDKNILFLGFLSKAKGCFDIPLIAKKVCDSCPNVRFILAGDGTPEDKEKIYNLINEYNIKDKFTFPGWVRGEEKDRLLKEAYVFFLPSYGEAMPMSILEAMGYGLPIISTNVGGIPQLVKDDINGYLLEPRDIQGFVNAITKTLTNNELKIRMGVKSLEIVEKEYSLDIHIEKIRKIYESIM